jgi:hypothetical protein
MGISNIASRAMDDRSYVLQGMAESNVAITSARSAGGWASFHREMAKLVGRDQWDRQQRMTARTHVSISGERLRSERRSDMAGTDT